MNHAGKCAGPPGWVSASGHLFSGVGKRRPGFLPPAPSFPRAGTSHHQDSTPYHGTAPPGLASPYSPALLLRGRRILGRAAGACTSPPGTLRPGPALFIPRSSRCSVAPRGCECPVACPAGKASRAGEVGCSGDTQAGRAARLRLLRDTVVSRLLPQTHSTVHQVPREFAVTFFTRVYFWGKVIRFAEFEL